MTDATHVVFLIGYLFGAISGVLGTVVIAGIIIMRTEP